jgi:hypothetical protein
MQFDPTVRHVHTLTFGTKDAASRAHSQVVNLTGAQFLSWDVQQGGRRVFVVLDQPPPAGTWQYRFATRGPLSDNQINQVHAATGADEALWNQL